MRALRSYGEKDIRVVDVDEPTPSGDKVIINVEWCGICGSDLHLFHMGMEAVTDNTSPHPSGPEAMLRLPKSTTDATPLIMGHEIAGRIAHSPDPASLPVGAPVVVDPCLFCGNCAPCAARQTQLCAAGISFRGFSTQAGGGFAEKIAVEPSAVYVLPEEAGARLAHAALVEPLAVAWHAVKRAGIATPAWSAADVTALVVGGGPVGVAVCYVLKAWGVARVVLSEPARARREGVRALVDEVVDPVGESVVERCLGATEGKGVDVVFECSGSQRVVADVFGSVSFLGTVVIVALWKGDVAVPFVPLMYKEIAVTASCAYNATDLQEVVKAFAAGRFTGVDSMVTARLSLEDVVEKGFDALTNPENTHVKILISPKEL
ncbi:chaperonin 10-like protein [Macrophomina phaseolina]|uniref:Chaperonin 10-like protein n=1 Tax=Macrophomina phaseolina TaxID=35725 RepID=A0ABQ8FZN4_9PEZI|nr:chaperonin 10-like protein [Macrophomina phaseolina]